ncbi:hypothetical protein GCM10022210_45500 [Mucilaginibacter dorajii]|uniref:Uncharacterized protein n=1 Tax=Mucilaginibacter dorajii TaxID=692994 RepID=A0ABP7QT56_9SPHI
MPNLGYATIEKRIGRPIISINIIPAPINASLYTTNATNKAAIIKKDMTSGLENF